ncbi:MAG: Phosphate propanoyltransferase [Clostridiales bacterium]|jgi:propanediol utilization protein|nr:Phosphate propanoyltransferase [Clostridiales bacterium]
MICIWQNELVEIISISYKIIGVRPNYALDMHIDIEEGNAAGIKNGDMGEIIL